MLAERKVGRVKVFLNAENLTGVRQTTYDSLVRPSQAIDGRWTVDAWAPLDGRSFNARHPRERSLILAIPLPTTASSEQRIRRAGAAGRHIRGDQDHGDHQRDHRPHRSRDPRA